MEALRGLPFWRCDMQIVASILGGVACVLLGGLVFWVAMRVGYKEGYESGREAARRMADRERRRA